MMTHIRPRQLVNRLGVATCVALLLAACGDVEPGQDATSSDRESTPLEPFDVAQAQASPDGRTLNLLVNGCSDDGVANVVETNETLTVDVRSRRIPMPCTTEVLPVSLDQPLGSRTVVNVRSGSVVPSYTADPPSRNMSRSGLADPYNECNHLYEWSIRQ